MEHKDESNLPESQSLPPSLKNDHVSVTIHRRPNCRIEFDVEVYPSLIKTAQDKAVKKVSKEVVIDGFRKGKAPSNLIVKHYAQAVEKQAQEELADLAFRESNLLAQIPLLNQEPKISFNMKNFALTGARVLLSFETEPQLPTINPKDIELKKVERPLVNEDKVHETVRQVQLFFAEWKTLEDCLIEEGHFVRLHVDTLEEETPKRIFTDTRFEVTDKSMAKWNKDLILGKKMGDIVEGTSIPDEDASESEKAELKPKPVRVTIVAVEEANIPTLDDNFAHKVGAASVEEMKISMENLLNKQANEHVQEKYREQLSGLLLTKFPFEIPVSLIDKETKFRMNQLLQDSDFVTYWGNMTAEARKRTVNAVKFCKMLLFN
jgi:trigger factor